jgi:hypothetical protein
MTRYDGWQDILEGDEKILWQGRPTNRFRIKPSQIMMFLFGIGLSGVAVYWMNTIAQTGGSYWMFGLGLFFVGIAVGAGPIIIDNIQRKNSWYTLTDRRAFIGTDMPVVGRRLQSYPINNSTFLDFRSEDPPSIYFAVEYLRGKYEPLPIDIGFVGIPDASEVLRLMRTLQTRQDNPEDPDDRRS